MKWMIVEKDREYAGFLGDPVLGVVDADSKERAEEQSRAAGIYTGSGPWAVPCPVIEADSHSYAFLVLYFYHTAPGRVLYLSGVAPDASSAQRKVAEGIHGLGAGKTALGFKIWQRGAAEADSTGEIHTGALVGFPRESRYLYGVVEGLPYPGSPYFLVNAITATGFPSSVCLRREQFTAL